MRDEVNKASGRRESPDGARGHRNAGDRLDPDYHVFSETRSDGLGNSRTTGLEDSLLNKHKTPPRGFSTRTIEQVSYRSSNSVEGLRAEVRALFLRSVLLCVLAATLSAQQLERMIHAQHTVQHTDTGHRDTSELEQLEQVSVMAHPTTPAHDFFAEALFTSTIFLGGAAIFLATLASARTNTGGPALDTNRRTSLVYYGRMCFKLAAMLNLIAFLMTSRGDMIGYGIIAAVKLIVKLAASSALALYAMERLK